MDRMKVDYDKDTKIWSGIKTEPLHNIEHHSLGKILFEQMRNCPNNIIQIDDVEGKSITSREALTWAIRIAQHFKKMCLRYDNIVGISARNTTYLMPLALGCFLSGVPFHSINLQLDENAIAHCFNITKPSIIFCDGLEYEKIFNATKTFKPLIYTVSEHKEGVCSILDLLEPTDTERFYQPEKLYLGSAQTVAILCSSGTTGFPKAVTMNVHKLLFIKSMYTCENVIYTTTTMDWMSGLMYMIYSLYAGCTRIISSKPFTAKYFIELTQKYKITNVLMTPNYVLDLTECPDFTSENLKSIKLLQCGGGRISKRTFEKVQKVLAHTMLYYGYGFSEIGGVSVYFDYKFSNSVGKVMPNISLRIVNQEGKNLGPNEIGEILVTFPYSWGGYYGNPKETLHMRDSLGWFHSGDLGYMDDAGCLYVIERKKEICKYVGVHYWLSEIENTIRELNEVIECCVVGIYEERYGDVAGALVIKTKDSLLTEQDVIDHVKQRLPAHQKQLHNGVVFVDELPLNFNGKIVKSRSVELFKNLKKLNLNSYD